MNPKRRYYLHASGLAYERRKNLLGDLLWLFAALTLAIAFLAASLYIVLKDEPRAEWKVELPFSN